MCIILFIYLVDSQVPTVGLNICFRVSPGFPGFFHQPFLRKEIYNRLKTELRLFSFLKKTSGLAVNVINSRISVFFLDLFPSFVCRFISLGSRSRASVGCGDALKLANRLPPPNSQDILELDDG